MQWVKSSESMMSRSTARATRTIPGSRSGGNPGHQRNVFRSGNTSAGITLAMMCDARGGTGTMICSKQGAMCASGMAEH